MAQTTTTQRHCHLTRLCNHGHHRLATVCCQFQQENLYGLRDFCMLDALPDVHCYGIGSLWLSSIVHRVLNLGSIRWRLNFWPLHCPAATLDKSFTHRCPAPQKLRLY